MRTCARNSLLPLISKYLQCIERIPHIFSTGSQVSIIHEHASDRLLDVGWGAHLISDFAFHIRHSLDISFLAPPYWSLAKDLIRTHSECEDIYLIII